MANVINMGGGGASVQSKTVKSTTTQQTISPPSGVDGFAPVIVSPIVLQEKTVTPSASQQVLTPPSGVDGFSKVIVSAATGAVKFASGSVQGTGSTLFDITSISKISKAHQFSMFCETTVSAGQVQGVIMQENIDFGLQKKAVAFVYNGGNMELEEASVYVSNGLVRVSTSTGLYVFYGTYKYSICYEE